jgi:hypothetical protein
MRPTPHTASAQSVSGGSGSCPSFRSLIDDAYPQAGRRTGPKGYFRSGTAGYALDAFQVPPTPPPTSYVPDI